MSICAPWATVDDVRSCTPCAEAELDEDSVDDAIRLASEVLYELSNRQWPGICTDTVRPCGCQTCDGPSWPEYGRYGHGDRLDRYDRRGGLCGCSGLSQVTLGRYPVRDIVEVVVDGAVVSPSAYRVDDFRWLVRTDGTSWPCCQNLRLPSTDDGTWEVTFSYGAEPPPGGVDVAVALGCELALARCGSSKCRLPQRVQSITRQGTSMVLLDPMQFLDQGRTGLYEVDLWLSAVAPKRRTAAVVASPDIGPATRRTSTPGLYGS